MKTRKFQFIKGEPGTGKTVLILHTIAAIKNYNNESKICIFLRNTQRAKFNKILEDYGLNPKKSNIDILTFNKFVDNIKHGYEYDTIIVDEAQRTTRITDNGIYPTGSKSEIDLLNNIGEKSVIEYLYKNTKHLVMTYDDKQRLRGTDADDSILKEMNAEEDSLKSQLRILKGEDGEFANEYINILNKLLFKEIDDTFKENLKKFKIKNKLNNYIKIAKEPSELFQYIKDKQNRFNYKKSVYLSGFCKNASSEDAFKFIHPDLSWSRNGEEFRDYNKNNNTVGNVYDIQGFDIDFAGVYIGKDLIYNEKNNKLEVNRNENKDSQLKRGQTDKQIEEFIKNLIMYY